MNFKKAIIAGTLVLTTGLGGYISKDAGLKVVKCTGKAIQYSVGKSYYCDTQAKFNTDWNERFGKVTHSRLDYNDLSFLYIVAKNNQSKQTVLKNHYKGKYNASKLSYDFKGDFLQQSKLLIAVADITCNNKCTLKGKNLSEQIYNLIK